MENTAPPSTASLYDACVQQALESYQRRLKQLKAMEGSLKLLEAFAPALEARGYTLHGSRLNWDAGHKAVRLVETMSDTANKRLHAALVELGFEEFSRIEHRSWCSLFMKHGRLRVQLSVETALLHPAPAAEGKAPL